ncbi:hypothetical protein GCM10009616_18270 [Microlunatus lacustris]
MIYVAGGVYWVRDESISLPPNDVRNMHPRRPVVVISGPNTNSDPNWATVLIMPTSTATTHRTRFCVKLPAGCGNLDKKTWARVPAAQPLLKTDLQDQLGILPADKLEEIQGRLLDYMGLLEDEDEETP